MHPARTALTALVGTAALAAVAVAPASSAPTTSGPVPADVSQPSPVDIQFTILDARDRIVDRGTCGWVYAPEEDDRDCLAFQGDPQAAVKRIAAAGGVRVVKHLQAPTKGIDTTTRITQRDTGVWVFRTTGRVDGEPWRYERTYAPDKQASGAKKTRR